MMEDSIYYVPKIEWAIRILHIRWWGRSSTISFSQRFFELNNLKPIIMPKGHYNIPCGLESESVTMIVTAW